MADILLVDDNPEDLDEMSYLLGHSGYSVRTARDVQSAIGEMRSCPDEEFGEAVKRLLPS